MKQLDGCNPNPCTMESPWRCSWRPNMLKEMMEYQRVRKGGGGYNEVIVSGLDWVLPEMIEAVVEVGTNANGGGSFAHSDLLGMYGSLSASSFPRLIFDFWSHPHAPFSIAK